MPRAALYCRVSTSEQDVGMQLDELRAVARQRGWQVVEEFVDEGVSGTRESRPALDKMIGAAKLGQLDVVVVWKLDRLARSLSNLLRLLDDLAAVGVGLVSLRDPGVDTTSPQGRLLLQLMGAFSEFERSLIRERVKAGVDRAKRRGAQLGRPRRDLDLERVRGMLAEGRTQREIAMALKVPRSTVRRALDRAGAVGPKTPPA